MDSLPCLLFLVCLRDTFIPEGRKIRDPRRLYAPGRIYHIVERKFCRCGRFPPEVRTAIPVDGRFEHIVLSCNATSDHGIIWIEREAEKALELMKERSSETITTPPKVQRFDRLQTIEKEHKDALERAVSLNIPHAVNNIEEEPSTSNTEELSSGNNGGESSSESKNVKPSLNDDVDTSRPIHIEGGPTDWNDVVEKLFERTKSGRLLRKPDTTVAE